MNGKHQVQKVAIDTSLSGDVTKIQDLIQTATNDAGRQVNEKLKAEVGKMTGGLGLPGMF
jgi:DNA-binding protein YbaB